ncbi:MAG: InlB B-repeat-containing protein, partial [Muribaculaceae bacterium]|nr:InlB B-repeat-containing protein [Muribaculaceae bacterium]
EKTVYAIWEKSTYKWTVTWKDGYTENPIKEETYTGTDNYDITGEYPADPKREGYEFAGWSPQISNLTKDDEGQVTITATWKRLATLHLVANFDGANPEEIVIYKEFSNGEAVFDITQDYSTYVGANGAKLPERPGYTFLGWSQDENGKVDTTSVTVSSPNHPNFYVYAVWKKNGSEAVVIAPGAVGSDY